METETDNLTQIERLNQRGGRTLSVVDLMQDGTISAEMAGFCWLAMAAGDSFITGAVPGGVGKTTLMGALLGFLPPGEQIVTVSDGKVIDRVRDGEAELPCTLLAHEIGSGHWFGYIWGGQVVDFLGAVGQGVRCVSCIHADDPGQSREALSSLGVPDEDFGRLSLQLYMVAERAGLRTRRRVATLWHAVDGELRSLYRWRPEEDRFEPAADRAEVCDLLARQLGMEPSDADERWRECEHRLKGWGEERVTRLRDVRERIRETYRAWAPAI